MDGELQALLAKAQARFDALTPEQQAEERRRQRESWIRGEMGWPKPKFEWVNGAKVYASFEDYCND